MFHSKPYIEKIIQDHNPWAHNLSPNCCTVCTVLSFEFHIVGFHFENQCLTIVVKFLNKISNTCLI